MKRRIVCFFGMIFLMMAFVSTIPIFAAEETSTMMCDEGVVNIGDADVAVQDKCGQPNSQSMNEWVYNLGRRNPFIK